MKKEKKTKKNQVRILLDKSREFGMASKFSQSVEYAQAAVDLAIQADDKLLEAEAYYNIGLMSGYLNQYDVSLEYQLKALKIHEAQKMSRMIAEDWNNIGYVYLQLKEYDRALESYRKSISNNPDSPRPYTNMSIIYKNLNKYEEALESADKARAIAIRIDNNRSIVLADLNIAEILKHLKQYDKALQLYNMYMASLGFDRQDILAPQIEQPPPQNQYVLKIALQPQQ